MIDSHNDLTDDLRREKNESVACDSLLGVNSPTEPCFPTEPNPLPPMAGRETS